MKFSAEKMFYFLKIIIEGAQESRGIHCPRPDNSPTLGPHLLVSPTVLFGTLNAVEGLSSRSVEAGAWHACPETPITCNLPAAVPFLQKKKLRKLAKHPQCTWHTGDL